MITMTQPLATIIAACIAVLAATIALVGVMLTVRSNERQHRERVESEQVARDRDATRASAVRRRDEAAEEIVAASEVAMRVWMLVGAAHNELIGIPDATPWTAGEAQLALEDCSARVMRLEIFGLDQASAALSSYRAALGVIWDGTVDPYGGAPDFSPGHEEMAKLRGAFTQTVSNLEQQVHRSPSSR